MQLFLEALHWVEHTAHLRDHLSPDQIGQTLQAIPPRELSILNSRAENRYYKEIAFELGLSIVRVRELYKRTLKECTDHLLAIHKPDPVSLQTEAERLQKASQGGLSSTEHGPDNGEQATQRLWKAVEQTLQKRLGSGASVVLGRWQTQITHSNPKRLESVLHKRLIETFAEQYAAEFREWLKRD